MCRGGSGECDSCARGMVGKGEREASEGRFGDVLGNSKGEESVSHSTELFVLE